MDGRALGGNEGGLLNSGAMEPPEQRKRDRMLGGMREIGRGMVQKGEKLLSGLGGGGGGSGKFNYDKDVHPQLWKSWDVVSNGGTFGTLGNFGPWHWEERVTVNDVVSEVCCLAPLRIGGIGVRGSSVGNPGWDQVCGLWSPKDNRLTVFGGKGNRVGCTSIGMGEALKGGRYSNVGKWNELVTRSLLMNGGRTGRSGKFKGKITCMEVLPSRRMVLVGDDRGDVSVVV